jgi:hypothetical protein
MSTAGPKSNNPTLAAGGVGGVVVWRRGVRGFSQDSRSAHSLFFNRPQRIRVEPKLRLVESSTAVFNAPHVAGLKLSPILFFHRGFKWFTLV